MSIVTGEPVRVSVNGTTLNTRVDGTEGKPWMVFCNSLASDMSHWDEQVAAFGARFRTLRYDQRGHGASDVPPGGKTDFEELSADLAGLFDHYGIDKAVLIGVSMGAATVMRFAARFSPRCLAVIACDGQWRTAPGSETAFRERMDIARTRGMAALAEPTARRWFTPDFYAKNPERMRRIERVVAATPVGGYVACVEALLDYDHRAGYAGIDLPVLYIAGQNDGPTPEIMREMAAATRGSRLEIIPDCGHLPNQERPEALFAAVDGFLRGLALE